MKRLIHLLESNAVGPWVRDEESRWRSKLLHGFNSLLLLVFIPATVVRALTGDTRLAIINAMYATSIAGGLVALRRGTSLG